MNYYHYCERQVAWTVSHILYHRPGSCHPRPVCKAAQIERTHFLSASL